MTPVWRSSISHAQSPAKIITRIFATGGGGDCDTCRQDNIYAFIYAFIYILSIFITITMNIFKFLCCYISNFDKFIHDMIGCSHQDFSSQASQAVELRFSTTLATCICLLTNAFSGFYYDFASSICIFWSGALVAGGLKVYNPKNILLL